jgi:hypothetical protein
MGFLAVVPKTADELWKHAKAILFLAAFLPQWPENVWKNLIDSLPSTIIFYASQSSTPRFMPLGMAQCFMVEGVSGFERVCEIHGVIRQDLRPFLRPRNYFSQALVETLLRMLFETYGVDAVLVTRSDMNNDFLKGFLRLYPFQRLELGEQQFILTLSAFNTVCRARQ